MRKFKFKATVVVVAIFIAVFVLLYRCGKAEAADLAVELGPVVSGGNTDGMIVVLSEIFNDKYEVGIGLLAPEYLENGTWDPYAMLQAYRLVHFGVLELGLGITYWQHRLGEVVGSGQVTFTELIRLNVMNRLMFTYRHWSNGGGGKKGFGEDALTLAVRF